MTTPDSEPDPLDVAAGLGAAARLVSNPDTPPAIRDMAQSAINRVADQHKSE